MTGFAVGVRHAFELPGALVAAAAVSWCHARRDARPTAPALHRFFAPLGLDMMAAGFDSLLCLFECAAGRPITVGAPDRPSPDQLALSALLRWTTAHGACWAWEGTEKGPLASAIETAAASVRVLASIGGTAWGQHGPSRSGIASSGKDLQDAGFRPL